MFKAVYDSGAIVTWENIPYSVVVKRFKAYGGTEGHGQLYCNDVFIRHTGQSAIYCVIFTEGKSSRIVQKYNDKITALCYLDSVSRYLHGLGGQYSLLEIRE